MCLALIKADAVGMKTTIVLSLFATLMFSILIGCSSNKNEALDQGFGVAKIQDVAPTIVDEFAESDELIDHVSETSENTLNIFSSWFPDGTRGRETPPQCRLSRIREELSQSRSDVHSYYEKFKLVFDECESHLAQGSKIGLLTDLKLTKMRYEINNNPLVHNIEIVFKNGEKIRGLLALKPDMKKRPFIIARCGVFCDIMDRLPRYFIMQLFDETPFNLLVLPSTTGSQYIDDNGSFGIGGYLEAAQHLKIAEYLRSSESGLNDRISQIHVIGASLGGNSAFLTSVLSQYNVTTSGAPAIASVFSLCPVVNLQETLDDVLHKKIIGYFMGNSAWTVIQNLYRHRGDPIPEKKPSVEGLLNIISIEAQKKYSDVFGLSYFAFKPFENMTFQNVDEVWKVNRFTDYALNVSTPTFAWTSYDDPIVPTKINTSRLIDLTQNSTSTNVKSYITPGGRHCAEPLVYGWSTASEVYKTFFLNFEPDFKATAQMASESLNMQIVPASLTRLNKNEFHFSQTWSLKKNAIDFDLSFQIWSPNDEYSCEDFGPYYAVDACFRNVKIKVPLSIFKIESHVSPPNSEAEAQALTRWANTNVFVFGDDAKELNHTRAQPATINWTHY